MKKKRTQPAHKSYFFEQGYKDIGTAIKTSWLKNAPTNFNGGSSIQSVGN